MSSRIVISIKRRWRTYKVLEGVLLGLGVGLQLWGLSMLFNSQNIVLSVIAAFLSMTLWIWLSGFFRITNLEIARYISKSYPQMQNSTELLTADSQSLNLVERIQLEKVSNLIKDVLIRLPVQWKPPLLSILLGIILFSLGLLPSINQNSNEMAVEPTSISPISEASTSAPEIESVIVKITPPSYTGLKNRTQETASIETITNSKIDWQIKFNRGVDSVSLVFANGRRIKMTGSEQFSASTRVKFNDIYHFEIAYEEKLSSSELYTIKLNKDKGPIIDLNNRAAFQKFTFGSISSTEIVSNIQDDFGITAAQIIATVAKGSGESVKFREEIFPFETSFTQGAKKVKLHRSISLDSLNFEPGDELYFYVLAADNKLPEPNISRSETYFVALIDTTEIVFSLSGNLGVDLMPEYFRSQRQIIIDTEKLLKDQAKITNHDFNFKSNELGFDQKVLRLKYGQFMGEEFVTDAGDGGEASGGVVEEVVDEETEVDLLAEFTHDHDSENDHNLLEVNDRGEGFGDADVNTYFSMSVRTKLKEAMTQMWDAELYLRLYQPENSLPYQYRALELIKEIKNHARIYVQRMGFDPPPIKPIESRLTGKAMDDVVSSRAKNEFNDTDEFAATRILLEEINRHLSTAAPIANSSWQNSGNELAQMVIETPDKLLTELKQIQQFRDGQVTDYDKELRKLYKLLAQVVPEDHDEVTGYNIRSRWNKALSEQIGLDK